ncbi:glucose-6-phosphate dehydrogenase assembly protein OpcA [Corynebacterium caspium]|uniref:glucose-6-phosphate dehydrogenase assembly protein OpcA n=1 Tax=Corynebacterium caspium TaxID=234828 RepID=UPI0003703F6E|nr:glucose-6-phosphate dehydrogenase assembly protein OpcA [Corynebacterium caspium]WKD59254.1 Glucose-6-phosphate dehydrogenase subunit [Corynebacterium caspium DSM 44850]
MSLKLSNTTSREIAAALQHIHETLSQTTGRVLTLIVLATTTDDLDQIISVTNDASREHPSRVLVLIDARADDSADTPSGIDASIRLDGSTGASELVIIRLHGEVADHQDSVVTPLLLPDTPIVAWWASAAPDNPAEHPIGKLAQRRITDCLNDDYLAALQRRCKNYAPGDSDLVWSRITQWRGVVASALDGALESPVTEVSLLAEPNNTSADIAAGWLAGRLNIPVKRGYASDRPGEGLRTLDLTMKRAAGDIRILTVADGTVSVSVPGRPYSLVAMNRRSITDCLSEELRHLDADTAYGEALAGLMKVSYPEKEV